MHGIYIRTTDAALKFADFKDQISLKSSQFSDMVAEFLVTAYSTLVGKISCCKSFYEAHSA